MNMKYKYITVLLAFLLSGDIFSQAYESTRKIERSFALNDQTEVRVYNKYGNVNIIPWNNDSVKFVIDLKVTGKKDFKVERVMDNITFDFPESSSSISAITSFENDKGKFWKDVSDFANIIFKGGTEANIDYIVFLPASQTLYIENKFGNFYTSDYQGNLKIKLSNGDIKAGTLTGKVEIESAFGAVILNEISNAFLNLSYSDMNMRKATKAKIISKSSTLNIDYAESIDIDSKRDKIYIRDIEHFSGKTSFTYTDIGKLYKEIVLKTNYGDINIDMVRSGFQFINLISDYTDCRILLPDNANFDFEINYNNKVNLKLPDNISSAEPRNVESNAYLISGIIGEKPGAQIKIVKDGGLLSIGYFNEFK